MHGWSNGDVQKSGKTREARKQKEDRAAEETRRGKHAHARPLSVGETHVAIDCRLKLCDEVCLRQIEREAGWLRNVEPRIGNR